MQTSHGWVVGLGCALVACGGGGKGGPTDGALADAARADAAPDATVDAAPDATVDAAPDATADATPPDARPDAGSVAGLHPFVVDHITLPLHSGDGAKYGLDLDGDGNQDNAVGAILSALSSANKASSPQTTLDDALVRGRVILLASVTSTDLAQAIHVPLEEYLGADPVPAPCVDPQQISTCGQHLKGTGMFALAPSSPPDEVMTGKIIAGRYTGGPGKALLPLSLTAGEPVLVHLIGAHADLPSVTDAGFTAGVLGGGIPATEVDGVLLPAMRDSMNAEIARDCPTPTSPDCGCAWLSAGADDILMFDKAPADCTISLDEITSNLLIHTLLAPDLIVDGIPALSVGVGISAVPATF